MLGFKLTTFGNESLPITTRPGLPSSIKFIYPSYKECKDNFLGAVVVAQLVEWSLPIPKVHGSNPAIGKNLFISIEHLFTINENREKEAGDGPFKKNLGLCDPSSPTMKELN